MASSKGYGRRGSNRLADMSLPPEVRRTPRRTRGQKAARAGKRERAAERAMDRERR